MKPAVSYRHKPDFPICNDPLGYADLVLNGDVKKYLDTVGSVKYYAQIKFAGSVSEINQQ